MAATELEHDLPTKPQEVSLHDGTIREGLAEVLPVAATRSDGAAEVFYNPAQVMNRDLSVLVLAAFGALRVNEAAHKLKSKPKDKPLEGMRVLEALAATGIRSIRYILELGDRGTAGVKHIVANDLDAAALEHMRRNLQHNGVSEEQVEPHCGDANVHMHSCHARGPGGRPSLAYDVVDIDPYGTSSPFLDAAVQAVVDGGLLCVTSTDMPVLAGNYPEACFARYGGTALKSGYLHEMSLRLLLNAIAMSASRYGREVEPLISCSIDFYIRVFVRIHDAPARVKHLASRSAVVNQCVQCETFALQPLGEATPTGGGGKFKPARVVGPGQNCPECGGRMRLGGPCYAGPLHSLSFVQSCLRYCEDETSLPGLSMWKKIAGLLTAISEELLDVPLFYKLPALCKGLKLPPIPLKQFRATLVALGFRASHFHREPEAVKTDAPNSVVYDLMRLWAEEHVTPGKCNDLLTEILKSEVALQRPFHWTTDDGQTKPRLPRFLPNPTRHWGPKPRAKGHEKAPPSAPKNDDEPARDEKDELL